ncbi:MAG: lipopolysaccharide assembly protein LapA domain-containing protein [Acidimicrobiales bacterium]
MDSNLASSESRPLESDEPVQPENHVAPNGTTEAATAAPQSMAETRSAKFTRLFHRFRLHSYAVLAIVVLGSVVALAVANTARVRVDWILGRSRISLVWLVLCSAVLGWILGLLVTAAFRWRNRAPRRQRKKLTERSA